ncbi:MAG: zinc ribbon domain-containing protein [Candidatus Thorarchaeota archaeon]
MQTRNLYSITLGFILVGLGLAILNRGSNITFFVFPFFFSGDLAPYAMILTLFIIMMFFWWVNKNWEEDVRYSQSYRKNPEYLRVGTSCKYCGNPLPVNATYCPSCGSTVGEKDAFP